MKIRYCLIQNFSVNSRVIFSSVIIFLAFHVLQNFFQFTVVYILHVCVFLIRKNCIEDFITSIQKNYIDTVYKCDFIVRFNLKLYLYFPKIRRKRISIVMFLFNIIHSYHNSNCFNQSCHLIQTGLLCHCRVYFTIYISGSYVGFGFTLVNRISQQLIFFDLIRNTCFSQFNIMVKL